MRLQDLNWMDVEHYLEHDDRIMLVTGSTEQHAYLSLATDALIPSKIADAAAQQEHVLIAPALPFGVSYTFGEFPGTITLSKPTFERVVLEIFESLFHQGFHKFLFVNGHGGNKLPERLEDFKAKGPVQVAWYDWWTSETATQFATTHELSIKHANWGENFPFVRVTDDMPKTVKPDIDMDHLSERYTVRETLGDGSYGGPYQIDDGHMNYLFELVVGDVVNILRDMKDTPAE